MKGVQCYELFGGIALKNHTFSFHFSILVHHRQYSFVLTVSGFRERYPDAVIIYNQQHVWVCVCVCELSCVLCVAV